MSTNETENQNTDPQFESSSEAEDRLRNGFAPAPAHDPEHDAALADRLAAQERTRETNNGAAFPNEVAIDGKTWLEYNESLAQSLATGIIGQPDIDAEERVREERKRRSEPHTIVPPRYRSPSRGIGAYLLIDGPDGVGKTTLVRAVAAKLMARTNLNQQVSMFAFPSFDGEIGQLIRRVLTGELKMEPRALAYLFVADAVDREHLITAAVQRGDVVLCDRHPLVAMWGTQLGDITMESLLGMQQRWQFTIPDITYVLMLEPAALKERMVERASTLQLFERPDVAGYLEGVCERYMAYTMLHREQNTIALNADLPVNELANGIIEALETHFVVRAVS